MDAAAQILRAGRQPTVADAAATAGVHRATAYRYFRTPEALRSEAALTAAAPTPEELVEGVSPDDPFALLDAVVAGFAVFAFADEALIRANVRHTVDQWFDGGEAVERGSRRFDYLAPVVAAVAERLSEQEVDRLRSALALVFGAEAVMVTRDVCGLDPARATEVMRWSAATLLAAALEPVAEGVDAVEQEE